MKQNIRVYENDHYIDFNDHDLFLQFAQKHTIIYAAGGLVLNQNNQLLIIHRLGKWDFPKGKIEKGETAENAAIREVMEETGVSKITNISPFTSMYHTYMQDNQQIIKETFWFLMRSNITEPLIPQTEEHITEVKWVSLEDVPTYLYNSYSSLQNLFSQFSNIYHL